MKRTFIIIGLMMALLLSACKQEAIPTWQEQYDLGVRYLSEGNYEEAIIAFTTSIEIEPMNAGGYLKLAEIYEVSGDTAQSAETLWSGWKNCKDERKEFLELLGKLGYFIDDNGVLQEVDWEQMLVDIESVLYPGTASFDYLNYDQMHQIYDHLIPQLQQYIQVHPQASIGYEYLSAVYCRLNKMALCLEVREEGYAQTLNQRLRPEETNIVYDDEKNVMTQDAWGRTIVLESTDNRYVCEYGDGLQVVRRIQYDTADQWDWDSFIYEYEYENGRLVSSVGYYNDGRNYHTTAYEYPEDGMCTMWTHFKNANETLKSIVMFDQYGTLQRNESYDRNGRLESVYHY